MVAKKLVRPEKKSDFELESSSEQNPYLLLQRDTKKTQGTVSTILDLVERYHPRTLKDYVWYGLGGPAVYTTHFVWELPPELHKKFNTLLGHATKIAAVLNPEVAEALGLAYSASRLIYGLKKKSGRDVIKSLVEIRYASKSLPQEKEKATSQDIGKLATSLLNEILKAKPKKLQRAAA